MLGRAKAWKHEPSFSSIKQSEHCVDNQRLGSTSTKKKHPPLCRFWRYVEQRQNHRIFPRSGIWSGPEIRGQRLFDPLLITIGICLGEHARALPISSSRYVRFGVRLQVLSDKGLRRPIPGIAAGYRSSQTRATVQRGVDGPVERRHQGCRAY